MARMIAVGSTICEMDGNAIELFNQVIAERNAAIARAEAADANVTALAKSTKALSARAEAAEAAVGMMVAAACPDMEMSPDDPVGMAHGVVTEIERLRAQGCDCATTHRRRGYAF